MTRITRIAKEHIEADKRCNRQWECACGACNIMRKRLKIAKHSLDAIDFDAMFKRIAKKLNH